MPWPLDQGGDGMLIFRQRKASSPTKTAQLAAVGVEGGTGYPNGRRVKQTRRAAALKPMSLTALDL